MIMLNSKRLMLVNKNCCVYGFSICITNVSLKSLPHKRQTQKSKCAYKVASHSLNSTSEYTIKQQSMY